MILGRAGSRHRAEVPLTLVTGFLGAGKTTAIRRWLDSRPPGERWAVLVNDFGVLTIDATVFDGVDVGEVAGGCACCAASATMRVALVRLLRRGPWDRILVELSGLGHPAALIDALRAAGGALGVRIDGVVAVVDATRPGPWLTLGSHNQELARAQVDVAGAIVFARTGTAPREPLERLEATLMRGLFGPRSVIRDDESGPPPWAQVARALASTEVGPGVGVGASAGARASAGEAAGEMSGEARSDAIARLGLPSAIGQAGRRWHRTTPDGDVVAWLWPPEVCFDRQALQRWAGQAAADGNLLRGKGALRTEREWYLWQHAGDSSRWTPTAWRRDNRVECLFHDRIDPSALERGLLAALTGR